ncbi:ATP-dependent RecD-like DNA helicase [Novosphingobium sp. TCA1]|uniref:ATP-dependent DNA helicase n=1 Tax=Novosphingobium sp. TCA1 TaxID=2682474 RepID=UPI0010556F80|nr:AAA family ATPase [Novosphingobium sp. TCA1]GFE77875.1 hypothetical protein NTCA1_55240 [Novosphingobium sp. TCA1]
MERVVVTSILSESWGGTIFSGKTESGASMRVRTWQQNPVAVGDVFEVDGAESFYEGEHGRIRQIEASSLLRARTSGRLIVPWLMTIKGIGRERAKGLFEFYGDRLLDALGDASRLDEIARLLSPTRLSLGRKLAEHLLAKFAARAAAEDIGVSEITFLRKLEIAGVSDLRAARKLWRLIGSPDAYQRLLDRPYATAAVIPWRDADVVGLRLLKASGVRDPLIHEDRLIGAVDAAWLRRLANGHTAYPRDRFEALVKQMGVTGSRAVDASLSAHRTIGTDSDLLRAPGAAFLERTVAASIVRLRAASPFISWIGKLPSGEISLNDEQTRSIHSMRDRCFSVLQGGAGVGKTTAMRVLCDWHIQSGGDLVQATISGKAALRLARATGHIAQTVARLVGGLEKRRAIETEGQRAPDHLPQISPSTLLIVDEASMVDLVSWRKLLDFVPDGARVVAVGDVGQLPPVGLGKVFHDLVEEGSMTTTLSQVMRQAAGNSIITASAAIRAGEVPKLHHFGGAEPGLQHASCAPQDIIPAALRVQRMLAMSTTRQDLLMLAGRRDTCSQIAKSMQAARQADGAPGVKVSPMAEWAAVDDPVTATSNRYGEALMNGQLGWIEALDPLRIRFDGEEEGREISAAARGELASGWCLTVHRAQGSEAKRVIVLLDASSLITREWLYTAVTRGVEQVVLVGPATMIADGVERREQRITGFRMDFDRPQPVHA